MEDFCSKKVPRRPWILDYLEKQGRRPGRALLVVVVVVVVVVVAVAVAVAVAAAAAAVGGGGGGAAAAAAVVAEVTFNRPMKQQLFTNIYVQTCLPSGRFCQQIFL